MRLVDHDLPALFVRYQRDPNDRVTVEHLLWLALEAGRPDVAAQVIESYADGRYDTVPDELRNLPERSDNLEFGLAFLLYRQGRFPAAIDRFRPFLGHARWGVWAHVMLGLCLSHERHFHPGPAVHHFTEALMRLDQVEPEFYEIYFHLASVYYRTRQFRAALRMLRQLHALDPGYPHVEPWLHEVRQLVKGGGDDDGGTAASASLRLPPAPPLEARGRRAL